MRTPRLRGVLEVLVTIWLYSEATLCWWKLLAGTEKVMGAKEGSAGMSMVTVAGWSKVVTQ